MEASKINAGSQDEDHAGPNPGEQDEGHAGPNPGTLDEGQARSNPGDTAGSQPPPSHVPHEENSEKTNAETEVQSMISVLVHQDTSSVPPMTTPVIDLTTMQSDSPLPTLTATTSIITTTTTIPPTPQQQSTTDPILVRRIGELEQHMADLLQDNLAMGERLDKHGTRLYNLENLDIPHKVSQDVDEIVTDAVDWAMQAPLRARFRDLPTVDMKEILQQRMFEDDSYKANNVHKDLYEVLQKSLELDYSNQRREALSSSKTTASAQQSVAWTTSDIRYESTDIPGVQELSPSDDLMHNDSAPDEQVQVSDDQDYGNDHTPTAADSRKDWWKPLPKEERLATRKPTWTIPSSHKSDLENNWASALATTYEPPVENSLLVKIRDIMTFLNSYCQRMNKIVLTQADFKGQAYEVVKAFYPDVIQLQFQMEECHKMLTERVNWANPDGDQGSYPALYISKMKAASYPDFGLELLVLEQIWIDDVCTYDVSAKYGISHWWFTRQKFYIDRHDSPSRRKEIAKKDFKNLYPSNFKDLNFLLLQGHLNYLSGLDKRMLSTAVKLWTQNLVIRQRVEDFQLGYEFKPDYTIIESPRAVIFPVNNNERKIIRFNEIYKFSDGTLTPILETLDYRVKEFKIKRLNPGMNTRFWTEKGMTRSKEFITAIERQLKTRRIYRNLECVVGGRVYDIDYRLLQRTE
ncbi:hypothetical protein Tco_0156398 [Tanacetum coccineum]